MKERLEKLKLEKDRLKTRFLNEEILSNEYNTEKEEIEKEIKELEYKIKEINSNNINFHKEIQKKEGDKMEEKKYKHKIISKKIKKDYWMYLTLIMGLLLITSIFSNSFSFGSSSKIAEKTVDFINNNLLQPDTQAKLISVNKEGNLYKLNIDISGEQMEVYVSKDGKLLFTNAINLGDIISAPITTNTPTSNNVVDVSIDDDEIKGDINAPVTIIEFSDYECPFCVRFYSQTFKQIDDTYIKTGKVRFVYRDFPLSFHNNAQKAAEAAECAGEQGKYYEMHNKLFEEGVLGGVTSFKKYAEDLGLNTAEFNSCLDTGKFEQEIQKDIQDGASAGVSGTPAFFINGREISGAQPFGVFQQIIEGELSK